MRSKSKYCHNCCKKIIKGKATFYRGKKPFCCQKCVECYDIERRLITNY